MPRKKDQNSSQKVRVMTYTMQPEVVEALEEIIKLEGHSTIHKAINACILQRQKMREASDELEKQLISVQNSKLSIEIQLTKLAQFQAFLAKHTKTI
jgi:butyrate kinase